MRIGIDFGTSFSLPALSHMGNNIILLPGGRYGIPSVFYYDEWENVLVGEKAEEAGVGDQAVNMKREIKMDMKSSFTADGKTFSGKQIVGYILKAVKDNAELTANQKLINEEIEGVVISVPVAFTHNEKEIIREAAQIPASEGGPGLKVLGFVKEPVAAALAYFQTSLEDHTRILVYDFGGGTCDVAVVEANSRSREKYNVIDSDMRRIGGKNWDEMLARLIIRKLKNDSGIVVEENAENLDAIKRAAVKAKENFSEKNGDSYPDRVRARLNLAGRTHSVVIERTEMEKLTSEMLAETINMAKDIAAKNGETAISKVVCVGGSSNMPQVTRALQTAFPGKEILVYEPEKAIAIGAAIYAQFCDQPLISDIASFSYGTDCYATFDSSEKIIRNLIFKGSKLPSEYEHVFELKNPSRSMSFDIFENDETANTFPFNKDKKPVMRVILEFETVMPAHTSARFKLTLNPDGLIEATAYDSNNNIVTARKNIFFD